MQNKNKSIFNTITFLWLFGLLASFTTIQIGIKTQRYNVTRLGCAAFTAIIPLGASKIFLPSEEEIANSKRRNNQEK